uniref:Uncharacterized protein n=1 Tax=Anopheles quadriannulatus TaxID=34691 RepID=A0A182XG39_ANOQN
MDGFVRLPADVDETEDATEARDTVDNVCGGGLMNMSYVPTNPDNPEYAAIFKPDQLVPDFILGQPHHCSTPKKNGRPVSMYEPWTQSQPFRSLPADMLHKTTKLIDIEFETEAAAVAAAASRSCWEAEDADEFITTLDESAILDIESYEDLNHIYSQPGVGMGYNNNNNNDSLKPRKLVVAADVHHHQQLQQPAQHPLPHVFEYPTHDQTAEQRYEEIEIYATVKKKPRERTPQSAIDRTIAIDTQALLLAPGGAGAPMQKLPKIMNTSCYGELHGFGVVPMVTGGWNEPGAIVKSNENLLDSAKALSMNSSFIDESGNSSLYEPNSMNSSFDFARYGTSEKTRVRWWDDFTEETEAELQDIAEKGRFFNS